MGQTDRPRERSQHVWRSKLQGGDSVSCQTQQGGPSGGELKTGQKSSTEDVPVDLRSSLVITRGRGQRI